MESVDDVIRKKFLNVSQPQFAHMCNGDSHRLHTHEHGRRKQVAVCNMGSPRSSLHPLLQESGLRSSLMSKEGAGVVSSFTHHPSTMGCLILQGCPSSLSTIAMNVKQLVFTTELFNPAPIKSTCY